MPGTDPAGQAIAGQAMRPRSTTTAIPPLCGGADVHSEATHAATIAARPLGGCWAARRKNVRACCQDGLVRFLDLAATSAAVTATSGRKAKIELLADALRRLDPSEIAAGSAYLAGELRQRQTGVGYAGLRDRPAPAAAATLTVGRVDVLVEEIPPGAG